MVVSYNESVVHIINLLRIKPSDRSYLMENFRMKSLEQGLDITGVEFLNTSIYRI